MSFHGLGRLRGLGFKGLGFRAYDVSRLGEVKGFRVGARCLGFWGVGVMARGFKGSEVVG